MPWKGKGCSGGVDWTLWKSGFGYEQKAARTHNLSSLPNDGPLQHFQTAQFIGASVDSAAKGLQSNAVSGDKERRPHTVVVVFGLEKADKRVRFFDGVLQTDHLCEHGQKQVDQQLIFIQNENTSRESRDKIFPHMPGSLAHGAR